MTSPGPDMFLNVDLLGVVPSYRSHLHRWRDYCECATEEPFMRRVLHRYERRWLPLVAAWAEQGTPEPPPDVHWVWQLHLLQPAHYATYCTAQFGRVLPHRLQSSAREAAASIQLTAAAWSRLYSDEPYEVDLKALRFNNPIPSNGAKLGYLKEAAHREIDFVYQVSLPHYADANFLYAALERYKKLALFRRRRRDVILRLPIDVQLMWRVHLLHPLQYADDTRRFLGAPDYIPGNTDSSVQDQRLIMECDGLWMGEFAAPLYVEGSGYRGRALDGHIGRFPRENYDVQAVDSCDVIIDELCVEELWSGDKQFTVEARLLGGNSFSTALLFSAKGAVGSVIAGLPPGGGGEKGLGATRFDAKQNLGVELSIYCSKGVVCFARRRLVSTKQFNPVQYLRTRGPDGSQKVILPRVTYTDPTISFTLRLDGARTNPHVFTMDRNPFEAGRLGSDLRQLTDCTQTWGSMGSLHVLSARHSLKCREGGMAFGVEVTKCLSGGLAGVMLYHNNQRLVAAAYSIDGRQLPRAAQVLETCPVTLDAADQAMLIRNHEGDFAVCIARWQQPNNGESGWLRFTTYFCQTRVTDAFDVRSDEMTSVRVGDVTVDLPTGRLTVDAACDALAEHVTWAFAVGVLFVTSQKSAWIQRGDMPGALGVGTESVRSSLSSATLYGDSVSKKSRGIVHRSHISKKLARQRKKSASFTYLLACGLQIDLIVHGEGSVTSLLDGLPPNSSTINGNNYNNAVKANAQTNVVLASTKPATKPGNDNNNVTEMIRL